jgi:hypothetical protein
MLALLHELTLPDALIATIVDEARRLVATQNKSSDSTIEPATIQAKLRRLGLVWADGLIGDREYEAEKARLRAMLDEIQSARPPLVLNEQRAVELLRSLPTLLEDATVNQKRRLVRALFNRVWVEAGKIVGVSSRQDVYPLLLACWRVLERVPDGFRTRNLLSHSQALCH